MNKADTAENNNTLTEAKKKVKWRNHQTEKYPTTAT